MSSSPPPPPIEDEQHARALLRIGNVVADKWQLEELLGVGGMAAVYAATHRNGKRVAVKLMHSELSHNVDARQRFLEEAYAANHVGHPGVVSVLDDAVTDDGALALVMELLDGETLEARLQRCGRLDPVEALHITEQLLDILAAAHAREIIHRDVKPENIFLTDDGRVKLLDFGIARMRETRRTLRTQVGSTMGTPAFMASEQARGRWDEIDGRTDLYAVGATLFVALTGRLVHQGDTVNEELLSAMTRPAPSLSTVIPDAPPVLVEIVDRALAFEKKARYADAGEMQLAVRQAFLALGDQERVFGAVRDPLALPPLSAAPTTFRPVTTPSEHPTEPPPFRAPRRALWLALSSAAGVLLIIAALVTRRAEDVQSDPGAKPAAAAQHAMTAPAARPAPAQDVTPAEALPLATDPREREAEAERKRGGAMRTTTPSRKRLRTGEEATTTSATPPPAPPAAQDTAAAPSSAEADPLSRRK